MSPWSVLGGSSVGRAHARTGVGCQDAYAVDRPGECLIVAVADGASSAPLASVGAPVAAALAVAVAGSLLAAGSPVDGPGWRRYLDEVLDSLLDRFRALAGSVAESVAESVGGGEMASADDLATTVTLVVVSLPWIAVLAIGDGFVVLLADDSNVDLLLAPPGGPTHPVGGTTFLTSGDAHVHARRLVARVPDLAGVAVSSDGLETLFVEFDGAEPLRAGRSSFAPLFAWAGDPDGDDMRLTRLLASERVCELTEDDKTMVVAVRR